MGRHNPAHDPKRIDVGLLNSEIKTCKREGADRISVNGAEIEYRIVRWDRSYKLEPELRGKVLRARFIAIRIERKDKVTSYRTVRKKGRKRKKRKHTILHHGMVGVFEVHGEEVVCLSVYRFKEKTGLFFLNKVLGKKDTRYVSISEFPDFETKDVLLHNSKDLSAENALELERIEEEISKLVLAA